MLKLSSYDEAVRWAGQARELGRPVVFTNGCFDVIHAGHVSFLWWLKSQWPLGAVIVALNTDDSIRRLKGSDRPVNTLNDRMTVIAALKPVDTVVAFFEDTPEKLIRLIKPSVLAKGGDYRGMELRGEAFVRDNGGIVVIGPHVAGLSSTQIIEKNLPSVTTNTRSWIGSKLKQGFSPEEIARAVIYAAGQKPK